jgi:hypothetical protein
MPACQNLTRVKLFTRVKKHIIPYPCVLIHTFVHTFTFYLEVVMSTFFNLSYLN